MKTKEELAKNLRAGGSRRLTQNQMIDIFGDGFTLDEVKAWIKELGLDLSMSSTSTAWFFARRS
jgi:hypothetical protein